MIDTPGILDHPLEDRNTIEMQSITALAHLRAAVLYFVDISEQCGYTIKQQVLVYCLRNNTDSKVALFRSIQPLFVNKPVLVVLNKIDVVRVESIKPEDKELIDSIAKDSELVAMSTLTEEGVQRVKQIVPIFSLLHQLVSGLR